MFYYSYIAFPIIGVFLLFIVVIIVMLIVRRNRVREPEIIEIRREEPIELVRREVDIVHVPNTPPRGNEFISDRNFDHDQRCVFNDSNPTFWRMNCGGQVCNQCIITISTAMLSSEVIQCPACTQAVFNFHFINEHGEDVPDLDTSLTCRICYERAAESRLDCQSPSGHYLCAFCYHRLVEVQKILICPFCRTLIKSNMNEEQAPVVLGMQ